MLSHAHRSRILALSVFSLPLVGCDEKAGSGSDAGADVGTDASTLCNTGGFSTEAPLTSDWTYLPMPRTVEGFGVCDVETTGVTFPSEPSTGLPRYEATTGCGLRTFSTSYALGLVRRSATFDASGTLVRWSSYDDAPTYVDGVECASYSFWAGLQTVPECADETTWRCRPGVCPRFLPDGTTTLSGLVGVFRAGTTLTEMDATSTCTTDPSSLPTEPTWGTDYVAVRTEGCGVVTYSLPVGPWERAVVYDATSGAPVGATSVDDVPAERESATCADETVTVGTYPAPDCPTNVVTYCTAAAGVSLR